MNFRALENNIFAKLFCIVISLVVFLRMAFANGYPLVYPDSGTYIYCGFAGFVPVDRPIFYGLFLRHISLAWSLWLPLIVQCFAAWWLVWMSLRTVVQSVYPFLFSAIASVCLSLLTTVSFHLDILIPDVFTSFMYAALAIYVASGELTRLQRFFLFLIISFSAAVHYSNLLSLTSFGVLFFLFSVLRKRKSRLVSKSKKMFILSLALWIAIPFYNSLKGYGFHYSKSTHVMTLAKMMERGILQPYLAKHCGRESLHLCSKPLAVNPNDFIYDTKNSPLYDSVCLSESWTYCWAEREAECNQIIRGILTEPEFRKPLIVSLFRDFWRQLTAYYVGPYYPKEKEDPVSPNISRYYAHESRQYFTGLQYLSSFSIQSLLPVHHIFLIVSLIIVSVWLMQHRKKRNPLSHFIAVVFAGIFLNALVCSVFIMVDGRYSDRLIWLLPLAALLVLHEWLKRSFTE